MTTNIIQTHFRIAATLLLVSAGLFSISACKGKENSSRLSAGGSGQELNSRMTLAERYPSIDKGSTTPENKKILCPFLRLLERAGLFHPEKEEQTALTASIIKIARSAREFGCGMLECGAVATLVSGGQATEGAVMPGRVNLERLHQARGVAHECGLTFAPGGTEVSDQVRNNTLQRLAARSKNGRLGFRDIMAVKLEICAEQGVELSKAGGTEVSLIYTWLGGMDRGYVELEDIRSLFHAELPATISLSLLTRELFDRLKEEQM